MITAVSELVLAAIVMMMPALVCDTTSVFLLQENSNNNNRYVFNGPISGDICNGCSEVMGSLVDYMGSDNGN